MNYHIKSELVSTYKSNSEKNVYEFIYNIKELKKEQQNAILYDKNSRIHFENPNAINKYIYEVDIQFIKLDLCKRLSKSKEINRKLFYRYDWLQLEISGNGKSIKVLNKDELAERWKRIRTKIAESGYRGDKLDQYLEKIDLEFNSNVKAFPIVRQYLYFGLLFNSVPDNFIKNWKRKSIVEFSPYENEKFEEIITSKSLHNDKCIYEIAGNVLPGSNTQVLEYSGEIIKPNEGILPKLVTLNTCIEKSRIRSEWKFQVAKV